VILALEELKDPRAVEPLAISLGQGADPQLVTSALVKIGPERARAFPILLSLLGHPNPRTREAAAGLVVDHQRSPEALAPLVRLLETDKHGRVRRAAAKALGYLGNPEAIPALERATQDQDPAIKEKAIDALRRLRHEE
jgi:HEAT repeat protein